MYNIQKAVSRLEFAPKPGEIEIVDIKRGLGVFTPRPGRPVSFAALHAALKRAGYALASAEITVAGTLARDGEGKWWLESGPPGQRFALDGPEAGRLAGQFEPGARVVVVGDWKTVVERETSRETINARTIRAREKAAADGTEKGAQVLRTERNVLLGLRYLF